MSVEVPVTVLRGTRDVADVLEEEEEEEVGTLEEAVDDRVDASLERDAGAEIGGRGEGRPGCTWVDVALVGGSGGNTSDGRPCA